MALKKIAISIPAAVLEHIDRAARSRRESRSRCITRILRAATRATRDDEITRKVDELFADPKIAAEQLTLTSQLNSIGSRHNDW